MKTLKFRAWDKKKKVMHNDFQFIKSGDKDSDWLIFTSDKYLLENNKTNPFINPSPHFAQQFEIMQYTGLKDKNGKDIYFGDILATSNNNPEFDIWKKEDWGYTVVGGNPNELGVSYSNWTLEEEDSVYSKEFVEIIGNIYKNKNLIK